MSTDDGADNPGLGGVGSLSVLLDGIVFSLQRHGGISETFARLLGQWQTADLRLNLLLYPGHEHNLPLQSLFQSGVAEWTNLRIIHRSENPVLARWRRVNTRGLPGGIFHSSYYRLPSQPQRYQVVTTLHDFMHRRYKSPLRRFVLERTIRNAVNEAQAVICVSEQTRRRLVEDARLKVRKLCLIPPGVAPEFAPLAAAERLGDGHDHALFLGQRGGYKNFDLAVRALAQVADLQLTIVGGGELTADERRELERRLPGRYRHQGWVSNAELNQLFNNARALVYPSAEEGFGMPVLEAGCAGCPVITTAGAVAEEAGSAPELRIRPGDADGLALLLRQLGADQALRAQIRRHADELRAGGDWALRAADLLRLYRELMPAAKAVPV